MGRGPPAQMVSPEYPICGETATEQVPDSIQVRCGWKAGEQPGRPT